MRRQTAGLARLALAITVGVAVGTATAAVARAQTRGAAAGERWRPLRSPAASATSFLQNNWNKYQENYHPNYVLDENPTTAWVEGTEGHGEGQSITLPLSPLSSARALRLRIWNGYQKAKDLFAKNSMPRRVRVSVLESTGVEIAGREAELERAWGPQNLVVEIPPGRGLAAVRLTILSVHPGTMYKDTCVSDILVDVDSEVPHNAAAENGKRAAVQSWVVGRKATAAYFATRPPEFPFAFTRFEAKETPFHRDEFKKRFAEADALKQQLGQVRYKPVVKKRIPAEPDGLSSDVLDELRLGIDEFLQFFVLSGVALFETSEPFSFHRKTDDGGHGETWITSMRAARSGGPQDRIRLLQFNTRGVSTERTTSTNNHDLLLAYDELGRLERVYRESRDTPEYHYEWIRVWDIFTFFYGPAGKVERVELLRYKSWRENGDKQDHDRAAARIVFTGAAEKAP